MTYYICQRNNQCKKKCNKNCLYTSNFQKSKLYHAGIKPVSVKLIKDKRGDYWEVNENWDHNLPVVDRAFPEEIIEIPYQYISEIELRRLMTRNILNHGKEVENVDNNWT